MDLKQLTAEMNRFVSSKGWYNEGSPREQKPRNLAISLVLEAAEVLEQFQWGENVADRQELQDELADVALYLLQLASITGIDLQEAILNKLSKNYNRTWDADKHQEKVDS